LTACGRAKKLEKRHRASPNFRRKYRRPAWPWWGPANFFYWVCFEKKKTFGGNTNLIFLHRE